jgi:glycosyltransferase involved in cell wall biosynthesis
VWRDSRIQYPKERETMTTMDTPRVSVIMPVYNAERYVADAVESILAQTFTDFEFMIVNDGSTDKSLGILEKYAARDERINLVSRPNTGYLVALNAMLGRARGEYVARMDADDVAMPQRFDRQVQYLNEHPECVLVGSRVIIIDPDGDPLTEIGDALTHEEIDEAFMRAQGQMVYHPSVIYRRQVVLDLGGYRPEYNLTEDLDLFLRLAEVGRIVNLAEPLLKYREHFQKIGYRRLKQQIDAGQRTLIDAYCRRGLIPPTGILERCRRPENLLDVRRTWGWWALMSGHVATARKHGWACLRRSPLSVSSWRLLYCALRGY